MKRRCYKCKREFYPEFTWEVVCIECIYDPYVEPVYDETERCIKRGED